MKDGSTSPEEDPSRISSSDLSIASFALALVSFLFGFTLLIPLLGAVLGIVGLRREIAGRPLAIAGVVLNGLILLAWIVIIGLLVASSS